MLNRRNVLKLILLEGGMRIVIAFGIVGSAQKNRLETEQWMDTWLLLCMTWESTSATKKRCGRRVQRLRGQNAECVQTGNATRLTKWNKRTTNNNHTQLVRLTEKRRNLRGFHLAKKIKVCVCMCGCVGVGGFSGWRRTSGRSNGRKLAFY